MSYAHALNHLAGVQIIKSAFDLIIVTNRLRETKKTLQGEYVTFIREGGATFGWQNSETPRFLPFMDHRLQIKMGNIV